MKVINFEDKSSVKPKDLMEDAKRISEHPDIQGMVIISEYKSGDTTLLYSDYNSAELYVLGGILQDYAMAGMRGNGG